MVKLFFEEIETFSNEEFKAPKSKNMHLFIPYQKSIKQTFIRFLSALFFLFEYC